MGVAACALPIHAPRSERPTNTCAVGWRAPRGPYTRFPVPQADRPPSHAYPKSRRLRLDRDFAPVRARGRRYVGKEASIRTVANDLGLARLGLSTSRKYGDAVRRNRFRRLAREAFRSLASRLPARDLLVEPRRDLGEPTLEGLRRDFAVACGTPLP